MPKIGLILPGERRQTTIPFAEIYRITVERDDGIACSDIEAYTTMQIFLAERLKTAEPRAAMSRHEDIDLNTIADARAGQHVTKVTLDEL